MNNIEKEFVPYELALRIKALGFNEPCFGEYRQWDGTTQWLQLYQDLDGSSTDPADYEYTTECLAPTFSQAFRFFREKYPTMIFKFDTTMYTEWYFTIVDFNNNVIVHSDKSFLDYNDCELECLKELIEIVKKEKL